MGTWALDAFGNDYAMDWAQDLHEYKTLELVETTLDNVIDSQQAELEAPFAAEALAALEVIARLQGQPGENDPATGKFYSGNNGEKWGTKGTSIRGKITLRRNISHWEVKGRPANSKSNSPLRSHLCRCR